MKTFIIHIILTGICLISYPQDSLINYLELAVKNNPSILQKYAEYEASLQKIPQAGSLPDPELSAGIFLSPMELIEGRQVADFRLMQMFPWFGTLKYAKDEMNLMAKAKYEVFRDTKLQILYEVQQSWQQLQKLQENYRLTLQNLEILKTIERITLVKYQTGSTIGGMGNSTQASMNSPSSENTVSNSMNGMGSNIGTTNNISQPINQVSQTMPSTKSATGLSELYRIQIETGNLENALLLLKDQINTETVRFNTYLNRPLNIVVTLPKQMEVDSSGLQLLISADTFIMDNPMLTMLTQEQKSLDSKTKMIKRMGYPMIGLGVNYALINKNPMSTSSMNGKDMIMPMVTVTLPIYRKKYKAMYKEAELLKTATLDNYQSTLNTLKLSYYEAMSQLKDSYRRLDLYSKQVQLIKQTMDITLKSFSASGSGLTDVLQVQQQLLDYETRKSEAISEYNTSAALLKRLGALEK